MSAEKNWQFELEEYIKQGEPGQIEKSEAFANVRNGYIPSMYKWRF